MNIDIFIILGIVTAVIISLLFFFLKKKKKKTKSFAHHYIEEINLRDTKVEKLKIEQVSIDHFNSASKGLRNTQKLENKKEHTLVYKTPTPRMK